MMHYEQIFVALDQAGKSGYRIDAPEDDVVGQLTWALVRHPESLRYMLQARFTPDGAEAQPIPVGEYEIAPRGLHPFNDPLGHPGIMPTGLTYTPVKPSEVSNFSGSFHGVAQCRHLDEDGALCGWDYRPGNANWHYDPKQVANSARKHVAENGHIVDVFRVEQARYSLPASAFRDPEEEASGDGEAGEG